MVLKKYWNINSQENEECKKKQKKTQKWAKITQNAPCPRVGDRCEFFMFVTTSAMPQRSISKVSEKNI